MSNDSISTWAREVQASAQDADSLQSEIDAVRHALADLVHTTRDLNNVRFDDDIEDYVIYEQARQLWDSVSNGVSGIRSRLDVARSEINDLRRVVDFYQQ
jgi:hypothetical protein